MRRVTCLLLCALLLATPALALDKCSMRPGTGIEAASCCASSCTCPAAGRDGGSAGDSSLGQCPGDHGAEKTDLASGTLVKTTLESRSDSDLVPLAVAHPAAAQGAMPQVAGHPALDPDRTALHLLQRPAFELFCTLLI